ncbi:hypothetical protein HQ590_14640 [bacterium]|nr:hypothetical protein [bacterium]
MKRTLTVALVLATLAAAPSARGWGSATHAHIADQIGYPRGGKNRAEIYSAMAADLFNTAFDLPDYDELYRLTHQPPDCLAPWVAARRKKEKAIGFGFACHNDAFGADSTAHHAGRTVGLDEGYIIAKAGALLALKPLPPELGIPEPVALSLAHGVVEIAVDIMIKRLDPEIGWKVYRAAARRSKRAPKLLVSTFAPVLAPYAGSVDDAAALILDWEAGFQDMMRVYGYALILDEATALSLFAGALADQAGPYLVAQGIAPPPADELEPLILEYLAVAQELCGPDYAAEIAATVQFVDQELRARGIEY